jgi:TRAP-type C4-dicarboxylate transport system permease small subunit
MTNEGKTSSQNIIDYLARFVEFVMVSLTVIMIVLVTYQVFERYVLHYTPPWSEELAVYLMIWFGIIGIAAGVRRKSHMALEYFADKMPEPVQKGLRIFNYVIMLIYSSVLIHEGFNMVELTMNQKSPAIGLPVGYVYLALPVSAVLMVLFILEALVKEIKKGRNR